MASKTVVFGRSALALLHLEILANALDPKHLETVLLRCTIPDQLSPVPEGRFFVDRGERLFRLGLGVSKDIMCLNRGGEFSPLPVSTGGGGGGHFELGLLPVDLFSFHSHRLNTIRSMVHIRCLRERQRAHSFRTHLLHPKAGQRDRRGGGKISPTKLENHASASPRQT